MSTVHIGGPARTAPAPSKPKGQTAGLVIAIVLLLIAGGLVFSRSMRTRSEERERVKAADPQVQIQQIRDNPHMPPQAKAFAEAQIRAHAGETAARGASQPAPPAR